MKIIAKISLTFILGLALSCSFASDRIILNGGILNPAKTIVISLDGLVSSIAYDVNCTISNASDSDIIIASQSAHYPEFSWMYLNDRHFSHQEAVKPGQNSLLVKYAYRGNNIVLTNSDWDNALIVDNCSATITR